jgi:hypothetical protein
MKIIYTNVLVFIFILSAVFLEGQEPVFGYISYSTFNIGDDIQALAARQFLPNNALPINRESIGVFRSNSRVHTLVNGWFMHTKFNVYYHSTEPAPQKWWPPAKCIEPLLISFHLRPQFLPIALSAEGEEYLRRHGPIGARDLDTLRELRARGIPSYFSGCLTLTFKRPDSQRENVIYAVDIDDECVNYIRSKTNTPVKVISHENVKFGYWSNEQRLQYAKELLSLYQKAKCVVTTRLHAALPCLAFQTPVFFIIKNQSDCRFNGLKELTRNGSRQEFLQGGVPFDFNNPPENPKRYIPLRKKLKRTVTKWVKRVKSNFHAAQ